MRCVAEDEWLVRSVRVDPMEGRPALDGNWQVSWNGCGCDQCSTTSTRAPEPAGQQASRAPEPGQQGMPPVDMTRVNYYTGHRVYEMYEDNFMTLLFLIVRGA